MCYMIAALGWMLNDIHCSHLGVDTLEIRQLQSLQNLGHKLSISNLVYTMRQVKDSEEIEILDTASIYADYMVVMTPEAIIQKLSEIEAFNYARDKTVQRMQQEMGELTFVNQGLVNGAVLNGAHSAHPHGLIGDRKPQPGDAIEAAFGALVYTYESESEHTFLYGEPSAQTIKYFNAMYAAWEAGIQAAKPGVTCADVNKAALDAIHKAGCEQYLHHRMGHGKGLQEHEAPWVEAGDMTILQPGMVISDEPGLYVPGYGGFRHSNTLVVTEDGCCWLTHYLRDLESCIIPVS